MQAEHSRKVIFSELAMRHEMKDLKSNPQNACKHMDQKA